MDLWAALAIGFFGSFHCVGMCGPIALAMPFGNPNSPLFYLRTFFYQFGRILTYALLGGMFGLLGYGLEIAGLQQAISITMGALMILAVVIPALFSKFQQVEGKVSILLGNAKGRLGKLLGKKDPSAVFVIGLLNGLLPCGLVYLGIAGALTSTTFWEGATFMAAFGLGTVPALMLVIFSKGFLRPAKVQKIRVLIPYFIVVLGIVFVLRGMNLGVPYLSPKIAGDPAEIEQCD